MRALAVLEVRRLLARIGHEDLSTANVLYCSDVSYLYSVHCSELSIQSIRSIQFSKETISTPLYRVSLLRNLVEVHLQGPKQATL